MESRLKEQEEKRMQDIAIQRMRMNATLDAREVESQLRADMDKDRMERVLQEEEEALANGMLGISGLGDVFPVTSISAIPPVSVAFQEGTNPYIGFSLGGLSPISTGENRYPPPPQTGYNHPGSSLPIQPLPPTSDAVSRTLMTTTTAPVSMPLSSLRATQGMNTTVTPSMIALGRPRTAAPSIPMPTSTAANRQRQTDFDPVSLMENMLRQYDAAAERREERRDRDLLIRVTNIVDSRTSPENTVRHDAAPMPRRNDSAHFRGSSGSRCRSGRRSSGPRDSSLSPVPSELTQDYIKLSKAFKMIKDTPKAEIYGDKTGPIFYRS